MLWGHYMTLALCCLSAAAVLSDYSGGPRSPSSGFDPDGDYGETASDDGRVDGAVTRPAAAALGTFAPFEAPLLTATQASSSSSALPSMVPPGVSPDARLAFQAFCERRQEQARERALDRELLLECWDQCSNRWSGSGYLGPGVGPYSLFSGEGLPYNPLEAKKGTLFYS